MRTITLSVGAALLATAPFARAADFKTQVAPFFKQYCYKCHSEAEKKEKGKLVLDNLTRFADKIGPSKIIKPRDAAGSSFFTSMTLPSNDDDHMPPAKEKQPAPGQIALVKAWITEGASIGEKAAPAALPVPPPPTPAGAPPMQTWTNTEGKAIQASFLRLEGDNVVIQRADGEAFIVPLNKLSPESQELAKKGGK